jgi:hypothetical protein
MARERLDSLTPLSKWPRSARKQRPDTENDGPISHNRDFEIREKCEK